MSNSSEATQSIDHATMPINCFEQLMSDQIKRINNSTNVNFMDLLKVLSEEALEWFDIDRMTLFPNSMILLNDGKSITTSRVGYPPLVKSNFITGNYRDYLKVLRRNESFQSFTRQQMLESKLSPLEVLHEEGAHYHRIIRLELFGQVWGR